MSKRLNDITGVVAMNPSEEASQHYSRSVRKIDNGYVTVHNQYGNPSSPDGPTHREVFSHEHPDHSEGQGLMGPNGMAMKRAVEFMKK